jgi:hypothetical protein
VRFKMSMLGAYTEMGGLSGDGIGALFGHPLAPENDAERTVRATLVIPWRRR